jgi:DmsE family decaheme c-type cytochrome
MSCSACHKPHNEDQRPLLRMASGPDPACVTCHADKRGPFVFEHPPLRVNGCQACHQPHGSVNTKLLRRAEVKNVCFECHSPGTNVLTSQPVAYHDLRSPRFRECTVCHREIHGSNSSREFLR